jgi:hypothetical protein
MHKTDNGLLDLGMEQPVLATVGVEPPCGLGVIQEVEQPFLEAVD